MWKSVHGDFNFSQIHSRVLVDGLLDHSAKRLKDGQRRFVYCFENEQPGRMECNFRILFWYVIKKRNMSEDRNLTNSSFLGYKLDEFAPIVVLLNTILHRKPKDTLSTVRNKYSHSIFHQVTKIRLLDIHALLEKHPEVAKKLGSMNLTYTTIISLCSAVSEPQESALTSGSKQPRAKILPTPQIAP